MRFAIVFDIILGKTRLPLFANATNTHEFALEHVPGLSEGVPFEAASHYGRLYLQFAVTLIIM